MTTIDGTATDSPPEESPTPSKYGPKRVRTKEMEIEQFDPRIIAELEDREKRTLPGFCDAGAKVGRHISEVPYPY